MKTLREIAKQAVYDGYSVRVNFAEKTARIDSCIVYLSGKSGSEMGYESPMDEIDALYEIFRHSVPSEKTEKAQRHSYFKGLPLDELSDEDVTYGESRAIAQAELELCVMAAINEGGINFNGGWFWQSSNDPTFIVLKEWTESKTTKNI